MAVFNLFLFIYLFSLEGRKTNSSASMHGLAVLFQLHWEHVCLTGGGIPAFSFQQCMVVTSESRSGKC